MISPVKRDAIAHGARCDICPLREAIAVAPEIPKRGVRLIVVGEGPGRSEEKLGRPFVGKSGDLLISTLAKHKIRRAELHLTNAALCRSDYDKENERAAECCAPRLLRELRSTKPTLPILALGAAPLRAIIGYRSILHARGFVWEHPGASVSAIANARKDTTRERLRLNAELKLATLERRATLEGRQVLPALHPAFILRADTWHPIFQIDMARAARLAKGEITSWDNEGDHRRGGLSILRWLGTEKVVSCDIETDGIDPRTCKITCIGFSGIREDGTVRKTGVLWPWKPSLVPRLTRFLATRKAVVFHNGFNFDLLVMRAHGVKW